MRRPGRGRRDSQLPVPASPPRSDTPLGASLVEVRRQHRGRRLPERLVGRPWALFRSPEPLVSHRLLVPAARPTSRVNASAADFNMSTK